MRAFRQGRATRVAVRLWGIFAWAALAWLVPFMLLRTTSPFPLDAFEDFELYRAYRFAQTGRTYAPVGEEFFPAPYPPFYYWLLGALFVVVPPGYVAGRVLSLVGLLTVIGTVLAISRHSRLGRGMALLLLAAGYAACGRYYEIARPDMTMGALVTVGLALLHASMAGETPARATIATAGILLGLACCAKQTAVPVALVALATPALAGNVRVARIGSVAATLTVAAVVAIAWHLDGDSVWHWMVTWPARHGFSWARLWVAWAELRPEQWFVVFAAPIALLTGARNTWSMSVALAATATGLVALGKWGAVENHLLLPVVAGSFCVATLQPKISVMRASRLAAAVLATAAAVAAGYTLPDGRDYGWLRKREREVLSWRRAVAALDGNVGVAHYWCLAAGARVRFAGFSDLAFKLPGWSGPRSWKLPDCEWVLVSSRPERWRDQRLARRFTERFEPAGRLKFYDRSRLLPARLYRRRTRLPAGPADQSEPVEPQAAGCPN